LKKYAIILDDRNIAAGTIITVVAVIIKEYCVLGSKIRVDREQMITEYTRNIFVDFECCPAVSVIFTNTIKLNPTTFKELKDRYGARNALYLSICTYNPFTKIDNVNERSRIE